MLQPGDERYLDGDGKPRHPIGIMLVLLFLLRGYAAWTVSLTFSDDRSKLLGFFYNNTEQFFLTLLAGVPALAVLILTFFMKPDCQPWVLSGWRKVPVMLWLGWILDGIVLLGLISSRWPEFASAKAIMVMIWCWAGWYLYNSRHWRRYQQLMVSYCSS
ncbi:Protein of unknown function [Pseudidiomarina planktonica]|uniref:DUF2919 domain-containing protein n=1 Tax=Pseudidiomarina planktonica TaxID=1323738 RepID=A0A1Y6F8E9_9GAMM|nr:DUF2919 family protein [Pseudidiomarina planktonica]RUO64998.1 DUF2919 domain-containing protein [Pseudidiomarina planktonica]SMQ68643.1 Protein of unknown function [Pseudidiomarina planktonica]